MSDLSVHFNRSEFACKCGCGYDTVDTKLIEAVEAVRVQFGPTTVTSGCRCPEHNEEVGGVKASQHVQGRAADLQVSGVNPDEVAKFSMGLKGISVGRYNTFTHIDSRSGIEARWDNR